LKEKKNRSSFALWVVAVEQARRNGGLQITLDQVHACNLQILFLCFEIYTFFLKWERSILCIKMMYMAFFYFNYSTKVGKKPYIGLTKPEPSN
jgi:hypothetical protein